jgi:hypothetical protein
MHMKLFISILLVFGGLFSSQAVLAQATGTNATPSALDENTQKKVDKAMAQIEKDRASLLKDQARYDKEWAKYDKKKAKGDLSPNDITKAEKGFKQDLKDIENLKKRINDNQALLDKYKQ